MLTVIVTIVGSFAVSAALLAMKWFYAHMNGSQEFREKMIKETTSQGAEVNGLRNDIKQSNEAFTKMFAEELHPLSNRVKRLKNGLNKVEEKSKLPKTTFEEDE